MRKQIARGFNVQEMLSLRREGWSTVALGLRYNKDHTTIVYHCLKHGVVSRPNPALQAPKKARVVPAPILLEEEPPAPTVAPTPHKYDYIFNELTSPGKTYDEYLAESLKRPIERAYSETFGELFKFPEVSIIRKPRVPRVRNQKGQFIPGAEACESAATSAEAS